jgi:hypothetical protein
VLLIMSSAVAHAARLQLRDLQQIAELGLSQFVPHPQEAIAAELKRRADAASPPDAA